MEEDKVVLDSCSFKFNQDSHCCSKNNDGEILEIEYLCDLGLDFCEGGYFVLKTKQWAIQDEQDLKVLIDRITKVLNHKK
jgi:hypothetical protein